MSDPGLTVLPTHRLVNGVSQLTSEHLQARLQPYAQLERIGTGDTAALKTWQLMQNDGSQNILGLGLPGEDTWHLARFLDVGERMAQKAREHSPAGRRGSVC